MAQTVCLGVIELRLLAALSWLAMVIIPVPAGADVITVACGNVGRERAICERGARKWEIRTGHKVRFAWVPETTDARFEYYEQIFRNGITAIDVFVMDVAWVRSFGEWLLPFNTPKCKGHEKGLPLTAPCISEEAAKQEFLKYLVESAMWNGWLVALPFYVEKGLLFINKRLVPAEDVDTARKTGLSWDRIVALSEQVWNERGPGISGYIFQGDAYEGLTVNVIEWLRSAGLRLFHPTICGQLQDASRAAQHLSELLDALARTAPGSVLRFKEEDTRRMFATKPVLFMRDWSTAIGPLAAADSAQSGQGSPQNTEDLWFDVAGIPSNLPATKADGGILGGWYLAVLKRSPNKTAAAKFVDYLTGQPEQLRRYLEGAYPPTRNDIYDMVGTGETCAPRISKHGPTVCKILRTFRTEFRDRPPSERYPPWASEVYRSASGMISAQVNSLFNDLIKGTVNRSQVERDLRKFLESELQNHLETACSGTRGNAQP